MACWSDFLHINIIDGICQNYKKSKYEPLVEYQRENNKESANSCSNTT